MSIPTRFFSYGGGRIRLALLALASISATQAAITPYRYYRFEAVTLAQSGTLIQLSEFNLSYQGKKLNLVAANPELTPAPTVGQDGTAVNMVPVVVTGGERSVVDVEGAVRIVDGSVGTKWLTNVTSNNGLSRFLTFDLGTPMSVDAYNFATGGDTATYPNRNPITWKVAGSNDNETWTVLDRQVNYATPPANSTFLPGFTANGVFPPTIYSFSLVDGESMIVKDGQNIQIYWDGFDEDLGDPTSLTVTPSISSKALPVSYYGYDIVPPRNADTTYTMTVGNASGTASKTLMVRSVTGGTSTYKYFRFTPTRTRSGSDQVQLSEFAFYRNGVMLNLAAANASPAQTLGSDGTNTNVIPVTVTNPGGSNDVNAEFGAVRLVDGYTNNKPASDGSFINSRFLDSYRKPVVFQFNSAVSIDSYQFTTSFESSNTDPVRWTMEGSSDGTTWTMIENVTAFDYPLAPERNTASQIFPLPGPSLKTAIGVVAPVVWTGALNGNYADAGNWNPAHVPTNSEEISISSGQAATQNANLERDAPTTISGTGALNVNGRFINRGTLNMVGGTFTQNGNYFLVGNTSPGTLNHSGGTISSTVDRGWFLSDFPTAAGSRYFMSGNAVLNVTNTAGGDNELWNVHIGKGAPGDLLNISGGTATFTTTTGFSNVYLSRGASLVISGGTVSFNNYKTFTLGFQEGAQNHFDISGGTVTLTNIPLNVGGAYDGEVTLGGGTLTLTRAINLGQAAGKGSFTMTGGQLTADDITSTANGTFTFSGGTIYLTGDKTAVINQAWFVKAAGTTASYDSSLNRTRIAIGGSTGSAFSTWASASGLTGNQAASTADADNDGVTNLMEFALNGSPTSAASRGRSAAMLSSGTGVLTLAVRNNAAFTTTGGVLSATVDGIQYAILGSRDLAAWTSEVEEVTPAVTTGMTNPDSGWTLRTFRVKAATGAPARGFLRLQVSETP